MPNRDMNEPFETVGKWFLPDTREREVPGTLSYQGERIELKLMDGLRPMQSGPIQFVHNYPLVHGVTREQEAVSLFRVQGIRSLTIASGGFGQPENLSGELAVV